MRNKEVEMVQKVVLSVVAHGDDVEFFGGGTLALMADQGHEVYLCIATDNDRGSYRLTAEELRAIARKEAEAAAEALGAKGVYLLGYSDGDLCDLKPSVLRGQIMRLIRQLKADVIFSWDPFAPFEDHPDHRALAWAVSDASTFAHMPLYHPGHLAEGLEPYKVTEWYWYSKAHWETNKRVDITDTIERKLSALYAYDCQMVLTLDDLLISARALGVDEADLAFINPTQYRDLISLGVRARDAEIGAELGTQYAEAFRYVKTELPAVFPGQEG
jgi:LmbE family N-acetylglucosaminyl deacetylase